MIILLLPASLWRPLQTHLLGLRLGAAVLLIPRTVLTIGVGGRLERCGPRERFSDVVTFCAPTGPTA